MFQFSSQRRGALFDKLLFASLISGILLSGLFFWIDSLSLARAARSIDWTTVQGTIDKSDVNMGKPDVQYEYEIAGQKYRSNCITTTFGGYYSRKLSQAEAEGIKTKFPAGRPVAVYYDPKHPNNSTLIRGVDLRSFDSMGWRFLCIFAPILGGAYLRRSVRKNGWKNRQTACLCAVFILTLLGTSRWAVTVASNTVARICVPSDSLVADTFTE
jgi:Protein of unknown function (DUF3592)